MATLQDYSADNPFVQAERSFFDARTSRRGVEGIEENWGSRREFDPAASPSVGGGFPSAVPSVTAKLTSIELLDGSSAGGGIDWFEYTASGRFDRGERGGVDVYLETAAALEAARVSVTEGQGDAYVEVMGATLRVGPKGSMWGDTWFQWFCEYDGITIALPRPDSKGMFAAKVKLSSLKLTRDGVRSGVEQANRLLETLGVIVESTAVYRVDCCVDLPGVKVDPFCESMVARECVTRMRAESKGYRRADGNWQGSSVGNRAGLMVRAYNKSHELEDVGGMESDAKRHALVESRWGRDAEDVSRIEVEMRGAWIRKHWEDVKSVDEVIAALPAIVGFVVTEFFRIVDGPVDRENNNQQRAKVSELWNDVVEVFKAVFGEGFDLQRKRVSAFKVNVEHARRRLVSAAKAYAAAVGPGIATCQQTVLEACLNAISSGWDQSRVLPDLREKWDYWRARVTADLAFEEMEPGSRAGAGPLCFPDSSQVPMNRWRLQDCLVPF